MKVRAAERPLGERRRRVESEGGREEGSVGKGRMVGKECEGKESKGKRRANCDGTEMNEMGRQNDEEEPEGKIWGGKIKNKGRE